MKSINRHFASDNYAGVHPEILEAIADVNVGHDAAYGTDSQTAELDSVIARHFGDSAKAFPVFNGTAANVLALQSFLPRWGSVITASTSHINVDEAGAPERVGGLKLLPVEGIDGKLTPEIIATKAHSFGDVHRAQPMAVSISQTTELGTCYTPYEVQEIAEFAHSLDMILHMDGARLSNAAAYLGLPFESFTSRAGVDVLSLGATKNGALGAEAVVLLNQDEDEEGPAEIEYLRKMNLQLASKMRFISSQLVTMYEGDLWLKSAEHANDMANRLSNGISRSSKGSARVCRPTESNAVFVELNHEKAAHAMQKFSFYEWQAISSEVSEYRLMCAFDTTASDVDELVELLTN